MSETSEKITLGLLIFLVSSSHLECLLCNGPAFIDVHVRFWQRNQGIEQNSMELVTWCAVHKFAVEVSSSRQH